MRFPLQPTGQPNLIFHEFAPIRSVRCASVRLQPATVGASHVLADCRHLTPNEITTRIPEPLIRDVLGKFAFSIQKMAEKLVTPTGIEPVFQP